MNNLSIHEVINEIENSINNLDIKESAVSHEFTSKNGKIYDVEISYRRRNDKVSNTNIKPIMKEPRYMCNEYT